MRGDSHHDTRLTARPHAFAGAVLSPKHARELTPSLCVAIATALADQNPTSTHIVPYTYVGNTIFFSLSLSHSFVVDLFRLWITEGWRVLGWAEPSAALFWEMATMYHTLLMAGRQLADSPIIPPILSCGSTSSIGSGATSTIADSDKKKYSSVGAAKELPVWLIGTFLLLHCEESATERNLSVEGGRVPVVNGDFTKMFQNPALSSRTRLHSAWNDDNSHCIAYLLRHLRKILLLSAIGSNHDATHDCMHLAAMPSTEGAFPSTRSAKIDANELRRLHNDEHGSVGLSVRLTMEDLEHLDLILQPPMGGSMTDPPLKLGEFLWKCLYSKPPPPTASIPMGDVEREIRQHLEMELLMNNMKKEDDSQSAVDTAIMPIRSNMASLTVSERAEKKETRYSRVRGTTVFLKATPSSAEDGASVGSNDAPDTSSKQGSRLHDLVVSDCSDAHFYLLQPFEYATIARCSGCTIVIGAVAGLLHIVDCEKTNITVAARRVLVSTSVGVKTFLFSPSPPLLVGDNRSCQFAPYNTFYEGLRDDLLATGLAAAVVSDRVPPDSTDATWPPLQCASNKWKQYVDVSKLEVPQGPAAGSPTSANSTNAPLSPGADDRAMGMGSTGVDSTLQAPVTLPPAEFSVLLVPIERQEQDAHYCRLLAEVLELSPFRMPSEYEKCALAKAERLKHIQETAKTSLTPEQQQRFEEELNRGFRDFLVQNSNLRQVLDLVHMDVKNSS